MKQIVINSIEEIEKYKEQLKKIKIWVCNTSCGKSYLCNVDDRFVDLDLYLSTLHYKSDSRNKSMTIVKAFKELKEGKIVLNASHRYFLSHLSENNIPFVYMYPNGKLQDEYVERMRHRGSTQEFIDLYGSNISENYKHRHEDKRGTFKIEMNAGEFVSDYAWKIFGVPKKFIDFAPLPQREFKIAFIDIDDTLADIHGNLSKFTIDVIRSLRGKIKIVLTSGRGIASLQNYAEKLGLNNDSDISICCNGGVIIHGGKIIYYSPLSTEEVKLFLNNFTPSLLPNISLHTMAGYTPLSDILDVDKFLAENEVLRIYYKNDNPIKNEDIPKVIKQNFLHYGEGQTFFVKKDNTKRAAMIRVLKMLNLSPKNAIAFGNEKNDLGFMKLSGCSVAVCNSANLIKRNATYIAHSNNDDGVARALLKLLGADKVKD